MVFVSISYRGSGTANALPNIKADRNVQSALLVVFSPPDEKKLLKQEKEMIQKVRDVFSGRNGMQPGNVNETHQYGAYQTSNARIRWGSVTKCLPWRAETLGEIRHRIQPMLHPPIPHDVMIAEVQSCGRHDAIELDCGRKSAFSVGDLVGVAFGNRYATAQFLGEVPGICDEYHMLSQGGVCGRVVSAPAGFGTPTVLKPLGYLANDRGLTINLREHAMTVAPVKTTVPPVILVVGASMDAGKTTAASAVVRGLTRSGLQVNAGKLTGTACSKDLDAMFDAGAVKVLDFNSVGFASTAKASSDELQEIAEVLISNLSAPAPDFLVLEIADGIVQRETMMLLSLMKAKNQYQHVILAVHDVLATPTCINMLEEKWGIVPTVVSGIATQSPLSTSELEMLTSCYCLSQQQLSSPEIRQFFVPVNAANEIQFGNGEIAMVG